MLIFREFELPGTIPFVAIALIEMAVNIVCETKEKIHQDEKVYFAGRLGKHFLDESTSASTDQPFPKNSRDIIKKLRIKGREHEGLLCVFESMPQKTSVGNLF